MAEQCCQPGALMDKADGADKVAFHAPTACDFTTSAITQVF